MKLFIFFRANDKVYDRVYFSYILKGRFFGKNQLRQNSLKRELMEPE